MRMVVTSLYQLSHVVNLTEDAIGSTTTPIWGGGGKSHVENVFRPTPSRFGEYLLVMYAWAKFGRGLTGRFLVRVT